MLEQNAMQTERIVTPQWTVDTASEPGLLHLILRGRISVEQMRAFVAAHNGAIDKLAGADYKVFCDIRELAPLAPDCAELLEQGKRYSDAHHNFRGSAVWVSGAVVSMQHARTSRSSGVLSTELISEDESALREHLAKIWRTR
jgi:hypothetical protein